MVRSPLTSALRTQTEVNHKLSETEYLATQLDSLGPLAETIMPMKREHKVSIFVSMERAFLFRQYSPTMCLCRKES